jgi:eukaryotic-like serine/threonine-protein kinase
MRVKITRKNVLYGAVILAAAYLVFNWTMSGIIHSRKEVMVPDLKGRSLSEAVTLLSPLNLGIKKESEEFDKTYPAGTVIRQNPTPGITVREGKIVRVTISQGGETIFVPDLTNQPSRTAEINIRSAGLNLGEESSRFSLAADKGNVVAQDPAPGAIADKEALVNLVISAGPPPENVILMPAFIGRNSDDAAKWASEKGINLDVREESAAGLAQGTVIRQEPQADTDVTASRRAAIVSAAAGAAGAPAAGRTFYYEIPQSGGDRQVRLVLLDDRGEKEMFNGLKSPGSKLEIPIDPQGRSRVRIFINNILVEERDIK